MDFSSTPDLVLLEDDQINEDGIYKTLSKRLVDGKIYVSVCCATQATYITISSNILYSPLYIRPI